MGLKITGTGSSIPKITQKNDFFSNHNFYDIDGKKFEIENQTIIEKFKSITGINERKYALPSQNTSDLAFEASKIAISDAKIDPETIDYIILAHNFGDISSNSNQPDTLPSLASRVKAKLRIQNPNCVAYDILCGCPGWVEGMIQANAFIKAKMAKKCLVIGADTLSRVVDIYDRDSMIYADGAGAAILEANNEAGGILSYSSATYTSNDETGFLYYGNSNNQSHDQNEKFIKMFGRKVYEFALNHVPEAMENCFEKSKKDIDELKKIFIHQANNKMDESIIKRFYRKYKKEMPENILPMNIDEYGNSSVATVPTLFDLVIKSSYKGHDLNQGDIIIFAAVGAGMNINAITYQI